MVLLPDGELPAAAPDIQFPSNDTFVTYNDIINMEYTQPTAYTAAEFAANLFPVDGMYIIGNKTEPHDHDRDYYTNGLLRYDSSFTFFLRAFPLIVSPTHSICVFITINNYRPKLRGPRDKSAMTDNTTCSLPVIITQMYSCQVS